MGPDQLVGGAAYHHPVPGRQRLQPRSDVQRVTDHPILLRRRPGLRLIHDDQACMDADTDGDCEAVAPLHVAAQRRHVLA